MFSIRTKVLLNFISHHPLYIFNKKVYDWYFNNDRRLYQYNKRDYWCLYKDVKPKKINYLRGSSLFPANYMLPKLDSIAGGNTGNFVFTRALESYILNEELFYNPPEMENTDKVIVNCANLLGDDKASCEQMNALILRMKRQISKFYFIGLGAQAPVDYSFNFSKDTQTVIKNFIKAVLDSGGGIGLRGFYTAELLTRLGFNDSDFDVIGCPSMFINGRNFRLIKNESINPDELKCIICDKTRLSLFNNASEKLFKNNVTYICQDECYPYLYRGQALPNNISDDVRNLFKEGKVKLFLDIDDWIKEIKKHNFSFGCRFHGNALAITNSVPAVINVIDSRTRELAEFFKIPHIKVRDYQDVDLYSIYEKADYTDFNKSYDSKFNNFKAFFEKHQIPNYLGQKNLFFEWLVANKNNPVLLGYGNENKNKKTLLK